MSAFEFVALGLAGVVVFAVGYALWAAAFGNPGNGWPDKTPDRKAAPSSVARRAWALLSRRAA